MYLPGFPSGLIWPYEWGIIITWFALGGLAYAFATYKSRGKVRIDPSRDPVEEIKEIIVEEKTNKNAI